MNIAIIGCGLIGKKRAAALGQDHQLLGVCDSNRKAAEILAKNYPRATIEEDWRNLIERRDIEAVIVSVPNSLLSPIALACLQAGKHVLIEKPAACGPKDIDPLIEECRKRRLFAYVGYNHRFHPAIEKARELVDNGGIGPLMFVRGRYGHGGRLGYEQEWRADKKIAGGGELIDQGAHLIDLAAWFLGDFTEIDGHTPAYFWKMSVEDNAFLSLKTSDGRIAWLHASCTEWKNLFSFEIYGTQGKLQIDGLGGSYGPERLIYYKMNSDMGIPQMTTWDFPGADASWNEELKFFTAAIAGGGFTTEPLERAKKTLNVIEQIYKASDR